MAEANTDSGHSAGCAAGVGQTSGCYRLFTYRRFLVDAILAAIARSDSSNGCPGAAKDSAPLRAAKKIPSWENTKLCSARQSARCDAISRPGTRVDGRDGCVPAL